MTLNVVMMNDKQLQFDNRLGLGMPSYTQNDK